MNLIVHTDGASRGNPGPAAAAFIITDSSGKLITQSGEFLGITTNNQAEYRAVLLALTWIAVSRERITNRHSESRRTSGRRIPTGSFTFVQDDKLLITFYLDSELVTRQLSGQYKIKSKELFPLAIKIKNLQNSLNSQNTQISFHSIPRNLNKPADRLVNQVLNAHIR